MGEHEKAIKDSTRAIELGDTEHANARAHETRARAYSELGKNALAHADLSEAYRLDPSFFFYLHPSSTDSYAQFVSNSSFASKNGIRWLGLVGILALLFVVVFKLALPSPNKTDHNEW